MAFHIRDKNLDMDLLQKAATIQKDVATASPDLKNIIEIKIKELLAKNEDELEEMLKCVGDSNVNPPEQNNQ